MERNSARRLSNLFLTVFLCVFVVWGCGGGGERLPVTVLVLPATSIVLEKGTQPFTATVTNGSGGVTWSLSCSVSGCGTLSNSTSTSVTYTAPGPVAGNLTVTLIATSTADTKQTGTATITVPAITIAVAPSSPSVDANTTQVFTASVNNTNNKNVTNWILTQGTSTTSCSPACGTLTNQGATAITYNAPAAAPASDMAVTIHATSAEDPTMLASTSLTVPAITVSVAPGTASIAINLAQSFRAIVKHDPAKAGVSPASWKLTQGTPPVACSPGCGTLTNTSTTAVTYTAPATVPTTPTVALTATSVTDTTKTGSATITIVAISTFNGLLKGQYAFLLNGFDDATRMQVATAGSLTADGKGAITGGAEDINGPATSPHCLPSCPQLNVTLTGAYSMGGDNRGILSITNSVGTTKYALAVGGVNSSGVATTASLIEFDDTTGAAGTRVSGVMLLQDSTAFSQSKITGPYAFGFSGQDSTGGRIATAGRFDADGAGNFKNGVRDVNASGTATTNQTFTGTYTALDTNGRATGTLTAGGATSAFVIYVVSANALLLETTGAEVTAGLQSGTVRTQTSTAFANSSLNGNAVFEEVGVVSGTPTSASVTAGAVSFTSSSTPTSVSGNFDANSGGTIASNQALVSGITYAVSANGRVTTTGGSGTLSGAVLYLVDINKGFVLEAGANTSFGTFEPQSASLSAASVSGNYFIGTAPAAVTASSVSSGVASADGVGTINSTSDTSASNGTLTAALPQSFAYIVSANGRTTVGTAAVAYVISPTKFVLIDVSTTNTAPTVSIFAQ